MVHGARPVRKVAEYVSLAIIKLLLKLQLALQQTFESVKDREFLKPSLLETSMLTEMIRNQVSWKVRKDDGVYNGSERRN